MKPLATIAAFALFAQPVLPQGTATFSTSTSIVVVNVSVLGRDGKPVTNLTQSDFLVYEDGKLQQLKSCELQHLDTTVLPSIPGPALKTRPPAQAGTPPASSKTAPATTPAEPRPNLQDHRLMVMLFDFSSMQPAEQIRAINSAEKFLTTQMTASDAVSIMVFGSSLKTVQDFTTDRDLLISTLQRFHIGDSSELASMADTGPDSEDQSGMFVADETEFNIFNTDRKLAALQDAARTLGQYPEKKALVYFSSGVEKTGVDNQSQLQATINTAVRSNVAFYPIDARGLTALAPGVDATQSGAVGSKLYSGAGQRSLRDSFQNQQETLYTLADDTGGKALLDSNDLTMGITQVQKDINSYYILTYSSTNQATDGRYRRIQVKLAPKLASLRAKLDYRAGYFAPTTFAKMNNGDKDAQLQQALESGNPITDLPIAVEVDYFRLSKSKYFVPVSVKIPGSALSFRSKGSKAATELDFIAEVRDKQGRQASVVHDTIPLKLDESTAGQVGRKQIQYDTGLTLAPGKYTLRFVARENGEGKVGTFETAFTIPDLSSGNSLRLSSVILSNQHQALSQQIASVKNNKKLLADNPLIDSAGNKTVPNVTRVFHPNQDLYAYLEVYDPAAPENLQSDVKIAGVTANLALYQGNRKILETQPIRASRVEAKRDNALPLRLQTPLSSLKPGEYTCQINVIDEFGHKFAFPRATIAVLPAANTVASSQPANQPGN
ncbi:MAG: VWA domain-containing protein [Bryobacteraceae bacterium]